MTEWTTWHEHHADKIALIAGVDCWIWAAGATPDRRHGRVSLRRRGEYAHRAAFEAANGYMPTDGMICHSCGVGLCVRPSHLYHGDAATNGKDASVMRRNPRATLSPDQVYSLREAYMGGETLDSIASRFGIAFGSVYPIVIGQSYRHVAFPVGMDRAMRVPRKLSADMARDIRRRLSTGGETQSKLAKEYGVASSVISRIYTGDRWKDA